jgi:hypothetical protein
MEKPTSHTIRRLLEYCGYQIVEFVEKGGIVKRMPNNVEYYYDYIHYTNKGAEKVAEIVYDVLEPFLSKKYNIFINHY